MFKASNTKARTIVAGCVGINITTGTLNSPCNQITAQRGRCEL